MRKTLVVAVVAAVLGGGAAVGFAADGTAWPSDQEARLHDVENRVLDVQRQLSVARHTQNAPEVERLSKEFKELRSEQAKLLRATGKLP
jgi:uncharacterized membrane protein (DUF106 family)